MVFRLFYLSDCVIKPEEADRAIGDMVLLARERNSGLGVGGALVFSGRHFAQLLEGPEHNVRLIMQSIERDHRHKNVTVLLEDRKEFAQFAGWALVYSGSAAFVGRRLEAFRTIHKKEEVDLAVQDMIVIMQEFTCGKFQS